MLDLNRERAIVLDKEREIRRIEVEKKRVEEEAKKKEEEARKKEEEEKKKGEAKSTAAGGATVGAALK